MFSSPASNLASNSCSAHTSLASLVDHTDTLTEIIHVKVDTNVIKYVVDCVVETVNYSMGHTHCGSRASRRTRGRSTFPAPLVKFTSLVSTVLACAQTRPATLLVALVYISRVRSHLCIEHAAWILERVFLGALICADKYTNDSTLKNAHWALCIPGRVFSKRDIGRIEREFLVVLDWELGVRETDLLAHHAGLVPASPVVASTHTPQARTHAYVGTGQDSVPTLEPSSPQRGLDSWSPRTPHSPASNSCSPDVPMDMDEVDMSSSILTRKGGEFDDILRAFSSQRTRSHPEWF
ncbi:hypothetical protein B0H13DRAFT_1616098 [Mycena leptocephala]|nr:hypothetical protein B0H13DRAFT_1616098 [Mycena leptocephala]